MPFNLRPGVSHDRGEVAEEVERGRLRLLSLAGVTEQRQHQSFSFLRQLTGEMGLNLSGSLGLNSS